ncbi:MAG: BON domain-containing protein [Gemmatimonadota bacterium]|nr:MAG: BON domain-containing protein [Gemmatimonadota bacterium]
MVRVEQREEQRQGVTGIALSAALGLGIGVLGGMVLREFFGNVTAAPVKNAMRLLRPSESSNGFVDPDVLERSVYEALGGDPDTESLDVVVTALGDGIVELTGTVRDAMERQLAGDVARSVIGADVVVNRILVEGSDRMARELGSEAE